MTDYAAFHITYSDGYEVTCIGFKEDMEILIDNDQVVHGEVKSVFRVDRCDRFTGEKLTKII